MILIYACLCRNKNFIRQNVIKMGWNKKIYTFAIFIRWGLFELIAIKIILYYTMDQKQVRSRSCSSGVLSWNEMWVRGKLFKEWPMLSCSNGLWRSLICCCNILWASFQIAQTAKWQQCLPRKSKKRVKSADCSKQKHAL